MAEYEESYVNYLKDELQSVRRSFDLLSQSIGIAKQCLIKWHWNDMHEWVEGRSRPVELHELIQEAIKQKYRIISVVVDMRDETGEATNAYIIALQPENGNLHM